MWTKKQMSSSRNSTKSGIKTKKKGLHLEICSDFHEFWGEDKKNSSFQKMCEFPRISGWNHKKRFFIAKSAKTRFLLTNSGLILGVSGIKLQSSGTNHVTFFGAQSWQGGHNSYLGGHKQWFGGAQTRNALVASGLLQVYSNLSNCNYRIFVNEILNEIVFFWRNENYLR